MEPLRSTFADDLAIADILPLFLANLPRYLDDIEVFLKAGDWSGAARVCHDLKGTAGGYGYPDIDRATRRLEAEVKGGHDAKVLAHEFNEVKQLCERARLVAPDLN